MSRPPAWWAAALLCTGCALATATPPQVEVAAVQVRGTGLLDQTLGVPLCVNNPNDLELAFRRIQVAVDAAGRPLAEGTSDAPVRLPPRSSVLVPFTVISTVRNVVPQLLGGLSTGAVDSRLHGSITLESLGVAVPFSRSGRFGLLAAGQELLADATAPAGLRCALASSGATQSPGDQAARCFSCSGSLACMAACNCPALDALSRDQGASHDEGHSRSKGFGQ